MAARKTLAPSSRPKHLGLPLGEVAKVGDRWFDVAIDDAEIQGAGGIQTAMV